MHKYTNFSERYLFSIELELDYHCTVLEHYLPCFLLFPLGLWSFIQSVLGMTMHTSLLPCKCEIPQKLSVVFFLLKDYDYFSPCFWQYQWRCLGWDEEKLHAWTGNKRQKSALSSSYILAPIARLTYYLLYWNILVHFMLLGRSLERTITMYVFPYLFSYTLILWYPSWVSYGKSSRSQRDRDRVHEENMLKDTMMFRMLELWEQDKKEMLQLNLFLFFESKLNLLLFYLAVILAVSTSIWQPNAKRSHLTICSVRAMLLKVMHSRRWFKHVVSCQLEMKDSVNCLNCYWSASCFPASKAHPEFQMQIWP